VTADIGDKCKDPLISAIIKNDFYMDDLMTGSDSIKESKEIVKQVSLELEKVEDELEEMDFETSRNYCKCRKCLRKQNIKH